MAQNVYDDPQFFAAYGQLRRSKLGLAGAPEWAALRALLPSMAGLRVLDLGCGLGWFCRWASEQGAERVLGLDISEKMLDQARRVTTDASITYERSDLGNIDLPAASFDLAFSSLALHYIPDFSRIVATVHQALVAGGRFVFSIEHPIYMAPSRPRWIVGEDGQRVWRLDSYQREGERTTDWLAAGVIKFHRTLGTTLNLMIDHGFSVRRVVEWSPTDAQVEEEPSLAAEWDRPTFVLIAVER